MKNPMKYHGKINYLNCGERYEDMINHRSYVYNLSSCEYRTHLSAKTCLDLIVLKISFYVF